MRLPIEIVSRRRRRANFDAYEIGQPVPGPLETLDSDEPWMDDHFTQENFEQLQDAQMDGELGPPLDMSKRAFASGTLPTSFTYWIDMDERGEFRATVYDPRGREVISINEEIFEDGYMRHKKDLRGLASYLEELGFGGPGTQVQIARNASFARRAGRPLHEIARDIRRDWKNVHFAAVPYLQAMSQLDSVNDSYFEDDGDYIVRYFLSNSNSWRSPVAKEIKAELKAMLPRSRFARFAEGDTAGFEKWLKSQPQKVQDDWAANKEKYGDKFKKKASNKQAKLMSRQEKILKDYLISAGPRAVMDYDDLPSSVRDALTRVKDQETLWSDVNRWLMDNNKRNMRLAWDEDY